MESKNLPWNQPPLDKWRIVGMYHYNMAGMKRLFVAMADKREHCIQSEGDDEISVFRELYRKANRYERKSIR
jgi:hypothetical protein